MSDVDDLRAARESRASVEDRANRPGFGHAITGLVNAAVYRATHPPLPSTPPSLPRHSTAGTRPAPLGPDFQSAMRAAKARIDALGLTEMRTLEGTVRYVDIGEGPPVLLVHGMFGGSDAALRQLKPLIPDGYRLIAPSRFGYLGSTLPAAATPARQADAFADLLDGLGIDTVVVLVVSAGVTSALQLATRYRDRVTALALLSVNGPGAQQKRQPMPYAIARALWSSDRLMWIVRRHFPERLARFMGVPAGPVNAADRARVGAELDGLFPLSRRVEGTLFDAFVSNPDINNFDFQRVTAPTLIVHARDDTCTSCWGAIALSQTIPGARLLLIEDGGGHLMLGEHPEVVTEIHGLLRSAQF